MNEQEVSIYVVGEPFPHPPPPGQPEGPLYTYDASGHSLVFLYRSVSQQEVEAVETARVDFGVFSLRNIVFLLARVEGLNSWCDVPFNWHLVPAEDREIPTIPESPDPDHATIIIYLVDLSSGLLRAIRAATVSPHFTRTLHSAIRQQSRSIWNGMNAYVDDLAKVQAAYPTKKMVQQALAKCQAGS